MMKFRSLLKPSVLLILIVLLAAVLRFYQLGINPPSLTWDEVAWGYNAYSLGIDGKDEFGHFLPYTSFVSFGDYKPPVYAYLTIIPVWLFGLNAFTVRFPSAFFGTLTVLITYFLVKELFSVRNGKKHEQQNFIEYVALVSSLFLAISPWHIMLSRAAFEANVSSFFIVTGVWLFLYAIRNKPWLLILSVVCFVVSIYTFNSARVVAPLLFFILVLGHIHQLFRIKKSTITAFVIGVLLLLPIVPFLLSPQARLRYQEVNIFSDINVVKTANQEMVNNHNVKWAKIIDNRRVVYSLSFLKHYFDNFNPSFLFITGDPNPKFSTQDVGQMYLWDLPFIIIGMLFLFRQRKGKWWILLLWLLISIIPAAVARETPHALRIESALPTFQILTGYGFVSAILMLKRYQRRIVFSFFVILFLFVGYYLHGYYTHYPKEFAPEWQYGYQQAIKYIGRQQQYYDKIYISGIERPYIYTLFYLKYSPQEFRQTAKVYSDIFGFIHVDSFGKYQFINPTNTSVKEKALFIAAVNQVPPSVHILQTFYLLDGTPELIAYTK
ncbi:MAG TPA: glycosyltransferase family 39 protein [Candidatus Sulfotelmatobacter sp.]|jgi:4-amino-4-deoxy-L-arabinose transferase-like glycosyltransferase|nr:glycosyltransferase family 39 protein [Candidatus Sulfotelmatobacter sp.]